MKAFINDLQLDLPPGFTLPLEQHSPIFSLDELRIADFSMNITFPGTPQNQRAFNFAHQLHQATKTTTYPGFRLETENGVMHGTLELVRTVQNAGAVDFETTFFTNLLPIDIFTTPLADIMTKKLNLGADTNQVLAYAKSQNYAHMSTNGVTGSVVKFVPTYAPEFYGDTNPDWTLKASKYNPDTIYKMGDVVEYTTVEEPNLPATTNYYIALYTGLRRNRPSPASEFWRMVPTGIFNLVLDDELQPNKYIELTSSTNTNGLLPSLQVHDVMREIAKAIGYRIAGHFMNDPLEQHALMFSNFALDKSSGKDNYTFVGTSAVFNVYNDWFALNTKHGNIQMFDGGVYDNESGHYDTTALEYTAPVTGYYLVKLKVKVQNLGDNPQRVHALFSEYDNVDGPAIVWCHEIHDIAADQILEMEATEVAHLIGGKIYLPKVGRYMFDSLPLPFEVVCLSASLELYNLQTDFVNIYANELNYRDHMPDCTVAEFLNAFKLYKNLYISFNPATRIMRLDYADELITAGNMSEIGADMVISESVQIEMKPKRRFQYGYGVNENNFDRTTIIEELDPVSTITDLPRPMVENACILVRNINAYYITVRDDAYMRFIWKFAGYNWSDLRIERTGDLVEIKPQLGPVPINFIRTTEYETYGPIYNDAGRSPMYNPGGARPPIQLMYWFGVAGNIGSGVPFASTTKYNYDGIALRPRGMDPEEQYLAHYYNTLPSLALEEIITATYYLSPYLAQLITFHHPVLLQHVPTLFIRTSRTIAAGERLIEAESRKIKQMKLEIVRDDAYNEDPDVDVPWTPFEYPGTIWIDFSDTTTLTISNDKILAADDKFGSVENFAAQAGVAPDYIPNTYNDLATARFNGAKYMRSTTMPILDTNKISVFMVSVRSQSYTPITGLLSTSYMSGAGGYSANFWSIYNTNSQHYFLTRESSGSGIAVSTSAIVGLPFISSSVWNGPASIKQWLNGIPGGVGSGASGLPTGHIVTVLGARASDLQQKYHGDVCELLIYNYAVTDSDRQKIEGYLAHKWGLAEDLPIDHPYRNAPPTI